MDNTTQIQKCLSKRKSLTQALGYWGTLALITFSLIPSSFATANYAQKHIDSDEAAVKATFLTIEDDIKSDYSEKYSQILNDYTSGNLTEDQFKLKIQEFNREYEYSYLRDEVINKSNNQTLINKVKALDKKVQSSTTKRNTSLIVASAAIIGMLGSFVALDITCKKIKENDERLRTEINTRDA